jgi:RNA polymerase sigma-70 factor, ECF subfamily
MSAVAITFGAERPVQESASVQLSDSTPWVNGGVEVAPIAQKSADLNESCLCYQAACEAELVSAAKNGDQPAFVELCRRYGPSLKGKIRRIVRNREDTEDILQDTLISAYKNLAGFRSKSSFHTWITTIATNNSLMLLRRLRNRSETCFGLITVDGKELETLELSDPWPNPEQLCAKREASHRLAHAVRILPPGFRVLVERYHHDEDRLVDAANSIGITVAAAKSRLLRARNVLRRHLKSEMNR